VSASAVSASAAPAPVRPPRLPGLLAAGLLAATLVGVPVQIYGAAALDFASASRDLLLVVFAAGLLAFVVLALVFLLLPARVRRSAGPLLIAVAVYAWTRSGFFPGPSVNLDGTAIAADLSTGWAGLLVPIAAGALLAGLAARVPRAAATVLAVLLAGSLVQSVATAASAWGSRPPTPRSAKSSLFEWSRKGNVLVLVLDAFGSDLFEDVLRAEPGLHDELDGFRYYRMASSTAPTTYLSVPTIHGGFAYRPGQSIRDFYDEAIVEGSFLNRLAKAGYRTSYSSVLGGCPRAVGDCTATAQVARTRVEVLAMEAVKLVDLGLYRVLPDAPRQAVLRHGRGPIAVLTGWTPMLDDAFVQLAALQRLRSASTVTDSAPTAKMVHTTLTHPPGMLRADCSVGERRFAREAVRLQSQCALRQVVGLFQRLRSGGAYDVTTIVILADHGYTFESTRAMGSKDPKFRRMVGSFNPTVLVKPAGARGPLTTSDAPIEIPDLPRALCGERECQPANVLLRLDEVDARRRRGIFWYTWNNRYWGAARIPGLARYWIEGDLSRVESWSREGAPYEPGDPIEFRRGGNLGAYVGFGWARREATETAMADPQATVWLRGKFEPSREYLLVIEARPVGELEPGSPAKVAVSVNGVEVGQVALGAGAGFETYRFPVPASVLSRAPDTLIRFSAKAPGVVPGRETARLSLRSLELRP
jgi:hypothetical protein